MLIALLCLFQFVFVFVYFFLRNVQDQRNSNTAAKTISWAAMCQVWPARNSIGWMGVICAVNIVWIWWHWKSKRKTIWYSVWFKPMTYHTFGHQAVCATSKVARIVQTWSQRAWTDGFGHPHAKRSSQPIAFRLDGVSTKYCFTCFCCTLCVLFCYCFSLIRIFALI